MSTSTNDILNTLRTFEVIPEVLPSATELKGKLEIIYKGGEPVVVAGNEIPRDDTQSEPEIRFEGDIDRNATYTIIMTDPDLLKQNDQMNGQVRHWVQQGLRFDDTGRATKSQPAHTKYLGCAPGPGSGKHRYIFILAQELRPQSNVDELSSRTKNIGDADLRDRVKFNAEQYIEAHGLKVVAVAFMRVDANLASTVTNLKLTGEAAVNAVLGK